MPKAPDDRRNNKVPVDIPKRPEEVAGYDLLKPIDEVPVWDQIDMVAMLQDAMNDAAKAAKEAREDENARRVDKGLKPIPPQYELDAKGKVLKDDAGEPIEKVEHDFDIRMVGDLGKAIIRFALNEADLVKFMSGKGAIERTANLAIAWVGQMGESSSSDDS
jgi:hypothetical protein